MLLLLVSYRRMESNKQNYARRSRRESLSKEGAKTTIAASSANSEMPASRPRGEVGSKDMMFGSVPNAEVKGFRLLGTLFHAGTVEFSLY